MSSSSPLDSSRSTVQGGPILGSGRLFEALNMNSELSRYFPYKLLLAPAMVKIGRFGIAIDTSDIPVKCVLKPSLYTRTPVNACVYVMYVCMHVM